MNTAMSSRRSYVEASAKESASPALFALIGGFVLMILGVMADVPVLMAVGFVPFVTAALYYNNMFWAGMYKSGKLRQSFRKTRISGSL